MLLNASTQREKTFVLEMARENKEKGGSVSLDAVTDGFVKKYDPSGKPNLFIAIRQLRDEGLLKIEHQGEEVLLSLSDAW